MKGRVALLALAVVMAVGAVVGLSAWNAAAHYERGTAALAVRQYQLAAAEFSSASVLGASYRDADLRAQDALRFAQLTASGAVVRQRERRVLDALKRAGSLLEPPRPAALIVALRRLDGEELRDLTAQASAVTDAVERLAKRLAARARRALAKARWGQAEQFALALAVLDPADKDAQALRKRAGAGRVLAQRMSVARSAARRGDWRIALRTARQVLAAQKGYPGAAALVADARRALAPKPRPTATPRPAAAQAPSSQGSGGGAAAPAQPAPP